MEQQDKLAHQEQDTYVAPKNVEEEMHREIKFSFIGFTVFDIGHIVLALIIILHSMIFRPATIREDISECVIELILAALLMSFVEGLAHSGHNIRLFRKNFSYAFVCAAAGLSIPLSLQITKAISFEEDFMWSICISVAFFSSLLSAIFFLVSLGLSKYHMAWRTVCLFGVLCFSLYVPFMLASIVAEHDAFDWLTCLEIIHVLVPVAPAVAAFSRLLRDPKKSALY